METISKGKVWFGDIGFKSNMTRSVRMTVSSLVFQVPTTVIFFNVFDELFFTSPLMNADSIHGSHVQLID